MPNRVKTERNKLIIRLKDKKGWTFEQIRKDLGLKSRGTVYEAYIEHKKRTGLTKPK